MFIFWQEATLTTTSFLPMPAKRRVAQLAELSGHGLGEDLGAAMQQGGSVLCGSAALRQACARQWRHERGVAANGPPKGVAP